MSVSPKNGERCDISEITGDSTYKFAWRVDGKWKVDCQYNKQWWHINGSGCKARTPEYVDGADGLCHYCRDAGQSLREPHNMDLNDDGSLNGKFSPMRTEVKMRYTCNGTLMKGYETGETVTVWKYSRA